jgi:mRNA interferase HigB
MNVVSKRTLRKFWESERRHIVAKGPLEAWHAEACAANWRGPSDVKEKYRSASILKSGRVVFNIKGNDYRLIVDINYPAKRIFVCWVGTHEEYDEVDAETVKCL